MNVAKQITKAKMEISRGLATQHPVKLAAGLALAAVLLTGTAMHYARNSTDEMGSPSSMEQQRVDRVIEKGQEVQRALGIKSNPSERFWEDDDGDHLPHNVKNPRPYQGVVESSPSPENVFPRWEEDDADHIPYAVNPLQYLGIIE